MSADAERGKRRSGRSRDGALSPRRSPTGPPVTTRAVPVEKQEPLPDVVTLCGSTRFPDAFDLANMHLSMLGKLVISVGLKGHADEPRGARFLTSDGDESTPEKRNLDTLHYRKIDLADTIYVINVGGYVGSSTKREIAYARAHDKRVEWMFPDAIPQELADAA